MPLAKLLAYKSYPLPEEVEADAILDPKLLAKQLPSAVGKVAGEPTIIPKSELPFWAPLIIYAQLHSKVPEIAAEIGKGFYVVLSTVHAHDAVTRPPKMHFFPELVAEPTLGSTTPDEERYVNLANIPPITPENIAASIQTLASTRKPVKRLILTGATDAVTALICFVMWRRVADDIILSFQGEDILM